MMNENQAKKKIGIDVMSGESGCETAIRGCLAAYEEWPYFPVFYGDQRKIELVLANIAATVTCGVVHCREQVFMSDIPSKVLVKKNDTSLHRGLEQLKNGNIDLFVTPGNSGAVLVLAIHILGRAEEIDRPALAVTLPTKNGISIMLDAGANVDCKPINLLQFAVLGSAYRRFIGACERPSVALLSNGSELTKGNRLVKAAHELLIKHQQQLDYSGYIEANRLFDGKVEVILCDGFTGNVVLKSMESLTKNILYTMKKRFYQGESPDRAVMTDPDDFIRQYDYREYGGAPLLGVKGGCIITHGNSGERAMKNAVLLGQKLSGFDFTSISGVLR